MDTHSQRFKEMATQCAYQTQTSTLDGVKSLESQTKANHRSLIQHIACSRSEASLQHLDTTNVVKAESENSQKSIQYLQKEVLRLREDQAKVYKLLKRKSMRAELKTVLKDFQRSNGRIDSGTSDSLRSPESSRMAVQQTPCPESHRAAEDSAQAGNYSGQTKQNLTHSGTSRTFVCNGEVACCPPLRSWTLTGRC